jgi:hypothetical protein
MPKTLAVSTVVVAVLIAGCAGPRGASRNIPQLASDMSEISRSYDYYNNELKDLSLPDPDSMLSMFAGSRTERLKRYYSKEMAAKRDRCYADAACRKSDIMGLRAQTLGSYSVVSVHQRDENLVTLMVVGTNTRGVSRRVIVDWMFEDGRWRINDVVSGPPG